MKFRQTRNAADRKMITPEEALVVNAKRYTGLSEGLTTYKTKTSTENPQKKKTKSKSVALLKMIS